MKYFKDQTDQVHGLDDTDPNQDFLFQRAEQEGWTDVTDSWPPKETSAQTQARYSIAIQNMLDNAARAKGYDGIQSAVSYADEPAVPTFQKEGQQFRAWRSMVWADALTKLSIYQQDPSKIPTVDAFLQTLPKLGV